MTMSQQVNNKTLKVNHLTTISLGKYLNEFLQSISCINSDDINII